MQRNSNADKAKDEIEANVPFEVSQWEMPR